MRLRSLADGHHEHYATTLSGLPERSGVGDRATIIPDCNRNTKLAIVRCAWAVLLLLVRVRPQVVITTGALPGLITIAIASGFGIRTVWIDSIANAEELSQSGKAAQRFSGLWLTQWQNVAEETGASYAGRVL